MIKAVIFDMDGVLIDSEPFWRRAESEVFGTVGIHLTEEDLNYTMGRRIDDVVEHWYHERPWDGPSKKEIEDEIVQKVIEFVKTEAKPMPGVRQALELFKEHNLPMAIASSSATEIIDAVVDRLGIRNYFPHIYSAENEEYGKPHPGVYITTAKLLGVPPHRCLAIEDSPSGVLSAKSAKMLCVAVPERDNRDNKYVKIADIVINSLEEINQKFLTSLA